MEIMPFKKPKTGPDSDGPGRSPSLGVRHVDVWIVSRKRKRKIQPLVGIKGACLFGASPLGREGFILAISTPAQKNRGDFCRASISLKT